MKSIKKFRWLPAIIILILYLFITPDDTTSFEKILSEHPAYPKVFPLTAEDIEWIETSISKMTLEEKCAQLIMPAVFREQLEPGTRGYEKIDSLVKYYKVGGLILFQGDLKTEADFINRIQSLSDLPLLIASDFERGLGTRLDDALEFPHAMALGAVQDFWFAEMISSATSDESIKLGVNLNFSPVADINNNSENPVINIRSFSEREKFVSGFVEHYIKGSEDKKIILAVKHFPGHGNTSIDSHIDLPKINGVSDYLEKNELMPFKTAIKDGIQAVMVGHLEVPAFDPIPGTPASLSKPIVTFLLREELGFDGLIITDAMNMEAITKYYSTEDAALLSIKAGSDIVLMPDNPVAAINSLVNAVNYGKVSLTRIDESVRRILSAKRWLKLYENKLNNPKNLPFIVQGSDYDNLANEVAVKSITLLKNDNDLIPLNAEKFKSIFCVNITDGNGSDRATYFSRILEARLGSLKTFTLVRNSRKYEYKNVLDELKYADLIILPTFIDVKIYEGPINLSAEQADFIAKILKLGKPAILISFKNPYLISLFPEATTYLNSFSHSPVSQNAMMRAILGESDISGIQPVSIPKTNYIFGSGLSISKSVNTTLVENDRNLYLPTIEYSINRAISENLFPGVSVVFCRNGIINYKKNSGTTDYSENSNDIPENFPFDLHSLTQLLAIDLPVLKLANEYKLTLDDPLAIYFPSAPADKQKITIRNLLYHTSGFGAETKYMDSIQNKNELAEAILNSPLQFPAGLKTMYSELNLILLQIIIERVSGEAVDEFIYKNFTKQVGLINTKYENYNNFIQSDHNSKFYNWAKPGKGHMVSLLNDISGFEGLYTTAIDLSKLAQLFIQSGYYDRFQIINNNTFTDWLSNIGNITEGRFRIQSVKDEIGKIITISFLDTAGNSLWIDLQDKSFLIALTPDGVTNQGNEKIIEYFASLNKRVYEELINRDNK